MDFPPPTEIQQKRAAWWANHFKPGMSLSEILGLNEKLVALYPRTEEESREKAEFLRNLPEFVL